MLEEVKNDWIWLKNRSFISSVPQCKVYIDDPLGYVVTVYFGFLSYTSEVASIISTIKKITTENDSILSFKYEGTTVYKTTYYWSIGLCHPDRVGKADAYYSFAVL